MLEHYEKHQGSVTHGEARCNIYTITLYPDNPNVKLSENFQNRLKDIDLAEEIPEKDEAMRSFIQEFGTHYGKKTIMGVGLKFENRWTNAETEFNSEIKLNRCTAQNGARILGMQLQDDTKDCANANLAITTGTYIHTYIAYLYLPAFLLPIYIFFTLLCVCGIQYFKIQIIN